MRIVLFGASGAIGRLIAGEAAARGHQVSAVVRDPSRVPAAQGVTARAGDVLDPDVVAEVAAGHDAVVSAIGPGHDGTGDPQVVAAAARSLIEGLRRAGVRRLVVVGGAGSLEVAPGIQLLDTPEFPEAWKGIARAHREALEIYRGAASDLDWTYFSPADVIEPGERTGRFRTGGDQLLRDADGRSRISTEDFAAALVDELEKAEHPGQRVTVAY
jgi:uncharacterized protein